MKKLILILIASAAFSCSNGISEKDIVGKYQVTFTMPADADTTDAASMFALGMFANANIQYEFLKGGTLNTSVKMGAMGQDNEQKWELRADSLFVDQEYYLIEKADKGFLLKGGTMNLTLTEIE